MYVGWAPSATGGRGAQRRVGRRRIARHAGQVEEALAVVALVPGGRDAGIGQPVVHGLHAQRQHEPQPCHLHGRRAAREHGQPVSRRVAGKVHQHVDGVRADEAVHLVVAHPLDLVPMGHAGLHGVGDGIAPPAGIDVHLDRRGIVVAQHRQHEEGDRVLAEVGGHVTDAQAPPRIAVDDREWRRLARERIGEAAAPFLVDLQRTDGIAVGLAVQEGTHHPHGGAAAALADVVDHAQRLFAPPDVEERERQAVLRIGHLRLEFQGRFQRGNRVGPVFHLEEGAAHQQPGIGAARIERQRRGEVLDGAGQVVRRQALLAVHQLQQKLRLVAERDVFAVDRCHGFLPARCRLHAGARAAAVGRRVADGARSCRRVHSREAGDQATGGKRGVCPLSRADTGAGARPCGPARHARYRTGFSGR